MTQRVLLLNLSYEPLSLVSSRRAFTLIYSKKAEVVEKNPNAAMLRSPSCTFEIPSIIKLKYFVKVPYRAIVPPVTRRAILKRDGYRCAYCQAPADTVDHIIPRSRGGSHDWANVVASCKKHNILKGDKLLSELGWQLRVTPSPPRGKFWILRALDEVDPAWEPYLELSGT